MLTPLRLFDSVCIWFSVQCRLREYVRCVNCCYAAVGDGDAAVVRMECTGLDVEESMGNAVERMDR